MIQASFTDLFETAPDEGDRDIQKWDLVRTGPNLYPHFVVLAVWRERGKVWLVDVQTGMDGLSSLNLCRKINGPDFDPTLIPGYPVMKQLSDSAEDFSI